MKKKLLAIFLLGMLLLVGVSNVSLGINARENIDEECDLNPLTVYDFAECEIYIRPAPALYATHYIDVPAPSGDYSSVLKVEYTADPYSGWEYDGYWVCNVYLSVNGNKIIFFDDDKNYFKFDENNEPQDVYLDITKYIPPGRGEGLINLYYYFDIKEDGITIDYSSDQLMIPLSWLRFPKEQIANKDNNRNLSLQGFLGNHPHMFPILRQLLGL